jgi:hypothetical protein
VATDLDGAARSMLEAATAPFVAHPSALALCHVRWEAERFLDSEEREAPRADLDADAMARLEEWSAAFLPGHAREGLARLLLGSVAEEVTRKGPCCVLVVRR